MTADTLELLFKIQTQGIDALDKAANATKAIALETKYSSAELQNFEKILAADIKTSGAYRKSLEDMARSSNTAGVATAGIAKDLLLLDKQLQKTGDEAERSAKRQADAIQRLGRLQEQALAENKRRQDQANATPQLDGFLKGFGASALGVGVIGGIGLQAGRALAQELTSAISEMIFATGKLALEQKNLGERTGLSVREVGLLSGAAKLTGVEIGSLSTGMRTLAEGLSASSSEGTRAKDALRQIGVSATDGLERLRPTKDLLIDISRGLQGIGDIEGRDLLDRILGRGGAALLPLFRDNLEQLIQTVKESGSAFSDDGAKHALEYERSLERLRLKWEGLKLSLGEHAIGIVDLFIREPSQSHSGPGVAIGQDGAFSPNGKALRLPGAPASSGKFDIGQFLAQTGIQSNRDDLIRRGNSSTDAYLKRYSETDEGRSQALRQAEQREKQALEDLEKSKGRSTPEDSSRLQHAHEAAAAEVERLRNAKKSNEEILGLEDRLREVQHAKVAGLDLINFKYDEEIAKLRERNKLLGPAESLINQTRSAETRNYSVDLIAKVTKDARKELGKEGAGLDRAEAGIIKTDDREFLHNLTKSTADLEKDLHNAQQILDIYRNADRNEVQRSADIAIRRVAKSDLGDIQKANAEYRIRLGLAEDLYDKQHQRALEEKDSRDRDRAEFQAKADRQKELWAAEDAHEQQLDQIRKQRRDEGKQLGSSLFDASLGGSSGIRSFFESQARQLGSQIAGNVSGKFIQQQLQSIRSNIPNDGIIGKALAGTILDPQKGKNPALDDNTLKTQLNTDALAANTQQLAALTGVPGTGGSSVSGTSLPPAVTGAFGRIFGGAIGSSNPFIFNQNSTSSPSFHASGWDDAENAPSSSSLGDMPGKLDNSSGESGAGFNQATFAKVATIAAGTFAAYDGFKHGGVRGDIQGAGGVLTAAGGVASLFGPVGMAVGLGLEIAGGVATAISSLFGDPKAQYEHNIQKYTQQQAYQQPTSLTRSMDLAGNYSDFDAAGTARSSDLSSMPRVAEPYYDWIHHTQVPGGVISPYGGPGGNPTQVTVQVQTMDSKSFLDNADQITAAVHRGISTSPTPLMDEIRSQF